MFDTCCLYIKCQFLFILFRILNKGNCNFNSNLLKYLFKPNFPKTLNTGIP